MVPSDPRFIEVLKKQVNFELKKYNALPFWLVILYLHMDRENTAYFKTSQDLGTYFKLQTSKDKDSSNTSWVYEYLASASTLDLLLTSKQVYLYSSVDLQTFLKPFDDVFFINFTRLRGKKIPKAIRTVREYYYRNTHLKKLITGLVNECQRVKGQIPRYLAIPYLFFNRNKTLTIHLTDIEHKITAGYMLKYNPQTKTIKSRMMGSQTSRFSTKDRFLFLLGHSNWAIIEFLLDSSGYYSSHKCKIVKL